MAAAELIVLFLFVINGIFHLLNEAYELESQRIIKVITKSLIIPLIVIFYILATENINPLIVVGLIFGLSGDVFLLNKQKKKNFIFGLGSFLLGHVIYIVAFLTSINYEDAYSSGLILVVVASLLLVIFLVWALRGNLGGLKIPVIVYSIILSFMSISAFMVATSPSGGFEGRGWLCYAGSILFLCSDGILAWTYFKAKFKHFNVIVMATYMTAQLLIAYGYIN